MRYLKLFENFNQSDLIFEVALLLKVDTMTYESFRKFNK